MLNRTCNIYADIELFSFLFFFNYFNAATKNNCMDLLILERNINLFFFFIFVEQVQGTRVRCDFTLIVNLLQPLNAIQAYIYQGDM
jgi:hypothetical protein